MRRELMFHVHNDTSLFDSFQLQVRSILVVSMRGWAQWAQQNVYSFPRLIKEFKFGLVVVGAHIRHESPYTFFDSDGFDVRVTAEVVKDRRLLLGHFDFLHAGERFISVLVMCRPVTMMAESTFAAMPSRLEEPLLSRFDPSEITDRPLVREIPQVLERLTPDALIAEAQRSIVLHRHECEAADQWSYIEIGANAASARESMILNADKEVRQRLQGALSSPIRSVDIEISRPLFLYDRANIVTRAYQDRGGLTFVHVYHSRMGGAHQHATIIERFDA